MTYFDKIKEVVQTHPEIHPAVVSDILYRCRDWLECEECSEDDNYIKKQYEHILRWVN